MGRQVSQLLTQFWGTVEWPNKSAKLCAQNITHKQIKYKNFLQEVTSSQKSENQNPNYLSSDVLQWPESQPAPRGHKQDTPGRLSGDFSKHKLDEIVAGGKGK